MKVMTSTVKCWLRLTPVAELPRQIVSHSAACMTSRLLKRLPHYVCVVEGSNMNQ